MSSWPCIQVYHLCREGCPLLLACGRSDSEAIHAATHCRKEGLQQIARAPAMAKQYKIGGVTVEFPYKAYGPQLAYMSKVVATLEQSRQRNQCNALLESPTGSGKSLALLCATLAWQQHYKVLLSSSPPERTVHSDDVLAAGGGFIVEDQTPVSDAKKSNGSASIQQRPGNASHQSEIKPRAPRIYYATRTHAQITQVIREYRKTKYRVPMALLASKKHYCTNKQVLKKKNVDEDCLVLLREPEQPGCRNFRNVQKVKGHPSIQRGACNEIHDIEDLVKIGHSVKGCAYFAARAMALEAEIVFCPYSYIIDPIIREAMEVDIRGAILIFDEAHNIEDVARDAGSIDLDISVLEDLKLELEHLRTFETNADYYQPLDDMVQELLGWTRYQANNLTKLEFEHHSSCWTGEKAVHELHSAGIPLSCFDVLLSCSRKALAASSDDKKAHLSGRMVKSLERLFRVLQFMLCNNARRAADYQLVVRKYVRRDEAMAAKGWVVTLSLWCLNPAVVFGEISAMCRSIIVTSGTLAPVESFASELGILFDVRIEAPHVVDMDTQVWAAALAFGPQEIALNASYKNSENLCFQDAIGAALLEIFKVTPDGVLVFFPSYKLLKRLCDRWQCTGHWLLLASQKQLFREPRVNDEKFESVLEAYYGAVKCTLPGATEICKRGMRKKFLGEGSASPAKLLTNGAAFLAVCRGKVSEGIDFSDAYARAVVVIGIPFPNIKDIQVGLKKQYNSTHQVSKKLLSGDQWYCQQAFRALNQAVGRCIRHRYDYGAIILLDERFKISRNLEYMSKWLRKSVQQYDNFQDSIGQLHNFFSRLKEFDSRLQDSMTHSVLVKNLPAFPIPANSRVISPIISVPITPLKSESGVLRVSNKLEMCTTSKTLISLVGGEGIVSCPRSGLLTQFDEAKPGLALNLEVEDIKQQELLGTPESELLLTQLSLSQGTVVSNGKDEVASDDAADFPLDRNSGYNGRLQTAGDDHPYCSGEAAYNDPEAEFTIVSIADDDRPHCLQMGILNDELLPTSLNTIPRIVSSCKVERHVSSQGLCIKDGSCGQELGFSVSSRDRRIPSSCDPSCFENSGTNYTLHPVTQHLKSDTRSIMHCSRCGRALGIISRLEIMTVHKSYLTSLLSSQSESAVSPTKVYLTDNACITSVLTEGGPQLQSLRGTGIQLDNSRGQQYGVWVEEDGCVYKSLVCANCKSFYIGVHIVAADSNNLAFIGKVAIFVESIRFNLEGRLLADSNDIIMEESLCCKKPELSSVKNEDNLVEESILCQQPVSCRSILSHPKRAFATTQPAKGKLKLQRRTVETQV